MIRLEGMSREGEGMARKGRKRLVSLRSKREDMVVDEWKRVQRRVGARVNVKGRVEETQPMDIKNCGSRTCRTRPTVGRCTRGFGTERRERDALTSEKTEDLDRVQ